MQNFGMGGPGGAPGAMYGAQGAGGQGGPPGGLNMGAQFPQPLGFTQAHFQQYKSQLAQFQQSRVNALTQMHQSGQINQMQFQNETHQINARIRQAFTQYQQQLEQARIQSQGGAPGAQGAPGGPDWRAGGAQGSGQMPPPGNMPMSAAEKKKMMEMQKRNMMAAQQAAMRFPPGTTPQQQQQMRMHAMQQQQQQQQQNYQRMGAQTTPQYPQPTQMQQPPGGMQQLQHMQQNAQQPQQVPSGPSVPNAAHQQQYQQQQYYQQQSQQQNQMHLPPQQQPQQPQQPTPQQEPQAAPAPAPAPAPPAEKPEDIKYKELLKEMKSQYLEVLQGMQRRQAQQKGLVQMVNILEGDRVVAYDHLLNLKTSLHRLMLRDCPTFPLMEEIRKIVFKKREDRERAALMTFADRENLSAEAEKAEKRLRETTLDDPMGVKPWRSVKHLTIRVPDSVRKLIGEPKKSLKRERTEDRESEEEEEVAAKKIKEDDHEERGSQTSVEEDISQIPQVFVVKTVFDTRKPWIVPPKAREELQQLSNWNVDEHCLPSCSASPFIIICIRSKSLLINPLRISLPRGYPSDPVTVQFDRTFPQDSEYGPVLQKLFEKHLGGKGAIRSLTDFVEAYQAACQEYQVYLPKYQEESSPEQVEQKTPEMEFPKHYPARPAAQNPIAHKGVVM